MNTKYIKMFAVLCASMSLVGCSNTKKIGTIGGINFYKVHGGQFDGPNFTALVTETPDKQVKVEYVFGSAGIGSSIIAAGGNIGAAAVLGTSFPKNVGDNNTVNGGSVNNNNANANNNNNSNSNNNSKNNKNVNNTHNGNGNGHDKDHDDKGNHGKNDDKGNHGKDDDKMEKSTTYMRYRWY
jgi:hypothetical protein